MSDVFNVIATWSQSSGYAKGQTMVATISGSDVQTVTTTWSIPPIFVYIGSQWTLTSPPMSASQKVATTESVVIDTARPVVDNSSAPHAWTVSANKLSISAVA